MKLLFEGGGEREEEPEREERRGLFTCRESTKSLMFRPYLSSVILAEVCYFCLEKKEKTKKERGKVELKFFNNFPFVFSFFSAFFLFFRRYSITVHG